MAIKELVQFRVVLDELLKLIEFEEKHINSNSPIVRNKSVKTMTFILPKLKDITLFYVKKFCNHKIIANNNAYKTHLRKEIVERVRKHTELKLPKKYAKILRTTLT